MNDPVPDLIIIAVKNFYIHFRIIFPEKMNHIRHPQSSDAGKTTDPQFPLNLIVDIEGGLAQLVFLVDHFLNVRDEAGTVVGEAVAEGEIPQIRYENYCLLYDELKNQRKY